jgi:hypothetical protein
VDENSVSKVCSCSRSGRVNEEGKGGQVWLRYFLYMCEYGTLKPVEVIS